MDELDLDSDKGLAQQLRNGEAAAPEGHGDLKATSL